MRRIEHLILQTRRQTENEQTGVTDGIKDFEFIQYFNDGQDDLYRAILSGHTEFFREDFIFDSVGGQDKYDLPADIFSKLRVVSLEYSHTGQIEHYRRLSKRSSVTRVSTRGTPCWYELFNKYVLVSPTPERGVTGGFRVTYDQKVPRLDTRRAKIATINGGGSDVSAGTPITAITLDTADPFNQEDYDEADYLSFVNRDGDQSTTAVSYDSVSVGGIVTLDEPHDLSTGETLAIGDWAVLGKCSTTTSQLVDDAESYLLAYAAWKIFKRDSSTDSLEQTEEMRQMKVDIIKNLGDISSDVLEIPIADADVFDLGSF